MKLYVAGIALLLTVFSGLCVQAQTVKASDITEITLKDDGGFGFDRGHEIVLRKDGAAEYVGGKNSFGRKGKYRGQLGQRKFARLAELLVRQKFFKLKERYEAKRLDAATVITSVAYSERRKTIQNYGHGGGQKLSDIQSAIEAVANEIKWEQAVE